MSRRFDLIVFDWDGTLVDSTAHIVEALQQAFRALDLPAPSQRAARDVIGLGMNEAMEKLAPDRNAAGRLEVAQHYRSFFYAPNHSTQLYDGVEQGLRQLYGAGYALAIATGMSRHGLDRALAETDLQSWIHASRTADQTASKPNPQMLTELLAELDTPVARTLMVGDTTYDLLMAKAAGISSVGMSYGAHPIEELQAMNPLAIFDDFSTLCAWINDNA